MSCPSFNDLIETLKDYLRRKKDAGFKNKKYTNFERIINNKLTGDNNESLVNLQFLLGENGVLEKIRKSIKASKQRKTRSIKNNIDGLINNFKRYSVFSNNSCIQPPDKLDEVRTMFIRQDLEEIVNNMTENERSKYPGIVGFKNYADVQNGNVLFNNLRNVVTHKNNGRNHHLFKYKDLLIAKRKRGMRKNRERYDEKIKLIDNLEEAAERFYSRTNVNRNGRIEEEMNIIRSLNRPLYDYLRGIFETERDTFNTFMRNLFKLDNRRNIYRLFNVTEIIDLIRCYIRIEEHIRRIENN